MRSGTITAGAVLPAFPPEIPHRRKHDVRVRRIDCDISATSRQIRPFEYLVPSFAIVCAFVESTIGRIAPERTRYRGTDRVAVLWAHCDLRNALGFLQTRMRPRFAAVG